MQFSEESDVEVGRRCPQNTQVSGGKTVPRTPRGEPGTPAPRRAATARAARAWGTRPREAGVQGTGGPASWMLILPRHSSPIKIIHMKGSAAALLHLLWG